MSQECVTCTTIGCDQFVDTVFDLNVYTLQNTPLPGDPTPPDTTPGVPVDDPDVNDPTLIPVLGPRGPSGPDGADGRRGPQGEQGDVGPVGPVGPDGPPSPTTWKITVRVATTGPITLSGTQTIDGVAVSVGNRVLVAFQSDKTTNGIYVVSSGAWSLSTDANTADSTNAGWIGAGMTVVVSEGTQFQDQIFTLVSDNPITLGVSDLVFRRILFQDSPRDNYPDTVFWGGMINEFAVTEAIFPTIAPDLLCLGYKEERTDFSKSGGFETSLDTYSVQIGYSYVCFAWPNEWEEPLGFGCSYILPTPPPPSPYGTTTVYDPNVRTIDRTSSTAGFGRYTDSAGRWYSTIFAFGRLWRVYVLNFAALNYRTIPFAPFGYILPYSVQMFVQSTQSSPPTLTPSSGSGPYPFNVTITCSAGDNITYKEFNTGDPSELPTPGSNGWSALVASGTVVAVSAANKTLRAQAWGTLSASVAVSAIASGAYT